ncbi:MAG: DNA-protecting protein DprA [Elusimicrobia bacterium]|nr:DNA-protecting protein DprA [Elusimicrobiota bacterium]
MGLPKDERSARQWLNLIPEMGPVRFRKLHEYFGSAVSALDASPSDWAHVEGFTPSLSQKLHPSALDMEGSLEAEEKLLTALKARVLISTDEEFPEGLKTLTDAPFVLYIKGTWRVLDNLSVAIVGTRRPTDYGRAAAERLARELAQAGVTVVSGLARGIDTAAHTAALKNKGRTVGVLGSGLNQFYPPENKALLEKMSEQGAVLSEFPLNTRPDRGHFPRRNRIISGLSLAVVVAEADEVSGALITARLAAEQGRDVFAVPGSVFSRGSRGPHRLLRQGARLAESAEDIMEEIGVFQDLIRAPRPTSARASSLSPQEESLLAQMSLEPAGMDDLSVRSGFSAASISALLLTLELKGLIRALPGKSYVRTEQAMV